MASVINQERPHRSPMRYPLLENALGGQFGGEFGEGDELHVPAMVVDKPEYIGVSSGGGFESAKDVCHHALERRDRKAQPTPWPRKLRVGNAETASG